MKRVVGILTIMLGLGLPSDFSMASDSYIAYVHRWTATEVEAGAVKPPLTLLWDRSPIFFERMNPGGLSESPSRRIAETKEGFVTVMKKTLYVLDQENGRTRWSLPLQGDEIFDWKLAENLFLYAAVDYQKKENIRGGVDLATRKEIWLHREPVPSLYQPERLIPTGDGAVVYVSHGDDRGINDAITAIDIKTGKLKWRSSTDVEQRALVPYTWFIYKKQLYTLVAQKAGGLYLKSFDLDQGKEVSLSHIFGTEKLGNVFHPTAVRSDGMLLAGYNKILAPKRFLLLGYDLLHERLFGASEMSLPKESFGMAFKKLVIGASTEIPTVATIYPDRFVVLESKQRTIMKDGVLSDYVGWTEPNATLYSYPYLFTSARRQVGKGMAYDFIALNVETGKVEWSYKISQQDSVFSTARAEILNFIVLGDRVYLSRADGRIMAFRMEGGKK